MGGRNFTVMRDETLAGAASMIQRVLPAAFTVSQVDCGAIQTGLLVLEHLEAMS